MLGLVGFALSVLPFLASAPAAGEPQAAPAQTPESVQESAEVSLVEVPVRVLDRHGNPLRDLAENDFEVFDDGQRQEIVAFDRIDLAQKTMEPGAPQVIQPAARRHFLLLFDLSFAKPKAVVAARRAAKEFVLGLPPNDFAAVATFSVEKGVRLLVTFSSDRVQLARAIDTLGLTDVNSLGDDPLAFVYEVMRLYGAGSTPSSERGGANREAAAAGILEALQTFSALGRASLDQHERGRVARLTSSLGEVASVLDAIPGRKDIVYLSEGFESRLLSGSNETSQEHDWKLSGDTWKVDPEKTYGNTNLQEQLKSMASLFRRSDCVIHAVDISGLTTDSAPDSQGSQVARGDNALFELADATGGEVFHNDNDFRRELDRLVSKTNLVYVLTFRPTQSTGEGNRYHELRVKVKVSGARTIARAGYYERPAYRLLSPLERNLVAADVIANETPIAQIPVRLLGAPMPGGGGPARVPVLIEISGPELLIGEGGVETAAEVYVYAYDGQGTLRDYFTQTIHVDLGMNRDRLEKGGLRYEGQLTLLPGDYRVRALVRNSSTGRMGLAAETMRVPDFSEKAPYLARPLFMESSADGIFVRGRSGAAAGAVEAPSLPVAPPDLVPAAAPEVRSGSPTQLSVVAYYFGDPQALKIGAQVLSEAGRPLAEGAIRVIGQTSPDPDGKRVLMVSFTPEQLSPGLYALRVFLRDGATGKSGIASAPFRVR